MGRRRRRKVQSTARPLRCRSWKRTSSASEVASRSGVALIHVAVRDHFEGKNIQIEHGLSAQRCHKPSDNLRHFRKKKNYGSSDYR